MQGKRRRTATLRTIEAQPRPPQRESPYPCGASEGRLWDYCILAYNSIFRMRSFPVLIGVYLFSLQVIATVYLWCLDGLLRQYDDGIVTSGYYPTSLPFTPPDGWRPLFLWPVLVCFRSSPETPGPCRPSLRLSLIHCRARVDRPPVCSCPVHSKPDTVWGIFWTGYRYRRRRQRRLWGLSCAIRLDGGGPSDFVYHDNNHLSPGCTGHTGRSGAAGEVELQVDVRARTRLLSGGTFPAQESSGLAYPRLEFDAEHPTVVATLLHRCACAPGHCSRLLLLRCS